LMTIEKGAILEELLKSLKNPCIGLEYDVKVHRFGPVTELFRSFKSIFCHKGDKPWHQNIPKNSSATQFVLH
jgi:hypothetical protein